MGITKSMRPMTAALSPATEIACTMRRRSVGSPNHQYAGKKRRDVKTIALNIWKIFQSAELHPS